MHRIGVCSWSLRPEGPEDLANKVRACGVDGVQLALDPIRVGDWDEHLTAEAVRAAGLTILSGMMGMEGEDYSTLESIRRTGGVRPDQHWPANVAAAEACAAIAERLQIDLVTFHAGFLPEDARDPERAVMLDRIRKIAGIFRDRGVAVALETGQESAETLIGVLEALDDTGIGVNFDPANMILYGTGDPVAGIRALAPWVRQVHIKDASPAPQPGVWGTERVVGEGAVPWESFLTVVRDKCPGVALVIERESGETRVTDVKVARACLERLIG